MNRGASADDFVEVYDEPDHHLRLTNPHAFVYSVTLDVNAQTLWHRHTEDTIYFALADTRAREEFPEREAVMTPVPCGAMLSRPHKHDPLIHKVSNQGQNRFHMVGAEALAPPPVRRKAPLDLPHHAQKFETARFRAYRLEGLGRDLEAGYAVFGLLVVSAPGRLGVGGARAAGRAELWLDTGAVMWVEPGAEFVYRRGFEALFAEWV